MSSLARKKIVFIIVEGPTDDEALGIFLNRIFDPYSVYVHIYRGDVTTQGFASREKAAKKIAKIVQDFASGYHFSKNDFREVIQITDMDGAFIPNSAVVADAGLKGARYSLTEIRHPFPENIIDRNERKRRTLTWLSETDEVWGIPYRIYYMSSNLDHVLYNKTNCTNEEKDENAYAFARKYRDDTEGFIDYICESDFSVEGDYGTTWAYIKKDFHSLERHTNLCVCIREAKQ